MLHHAIERLLILGSSRREFGIFIIIQHDSRLTKRQGLIDDVQSVWVVFSEAGDTLLIVLMCLNDCSIVLIHVMDALHSEYVMIC